MKLYAKLIYQVPSERRSSHPNSINLAGHGYRNKHEIINVQIKQTDDKYLKTNDRKGYIWIKGVRQELEAITMKIKW